MANVDARTGYKDRSSNDVPLSTEPELTLSYNLKLLAALCLLIGVAAGAWMMTP